jgi:hypothetical protein
MNNGSWLRCLLVDINKLRNRGYQLFLLFMFLIFVGLSIKIGSMIGPLGDINAYWKAGWNFFHGNELYLHIWDEGRFIYPPFSAMLFQFFALFPVKVAAGILVFINLILFLFSIYLVRSIFEFYCSDTKFINKMLFFSTLLSFRFFWSCFQFTQMNEVILVLCLQGILFMLKKKETPAIICFVTATFIKIIPVFFLIWLVFRGNLRTYLKILITILLCLIIPLIWRGFYTGIMDLKNYYIEFLKPFQEGRVEYPFTNQSLSAAIYKLFRPLNDTQNLGDAHTQDFQLFYLPIDTVSKIYSFSAALIFITFIIYLFYLRFQKKEITFLEISMILLVTHLLSSITWDYHLVSLLFVYMSFLMLLKEKQNGISKWISYSLIVMMLFNAIVGKDTSGMFIYHILEGYSLLTWMMVLLFFFFLWKNNTKEVLQSS